MGGGKSPPCPITPTNDAPMKDPINLYRRFGYNLDLLPHPILKDAERGVANTEEARHNSGMTIGHPGWGLIYHMLLSHLRPFEEEIIIETGTNEGMTSIVMAQAIIDTPCKGRIITFERGHLNLIKSKANVEKAGFGEIIEIVEGNIRKTLKPRLEGLSGIRFAFVDACHLYQDVMGEFETLLPHLADDALVLFDNTFDIADEGDDIRVNGALKEIRRKHGGNLINLEFVSWGTPGLAIWQREPKL